MYFFQKLFSPSWVKHKRANKLPVAMEMVLALALGLINSIYGDVFEYPESYIPLPLRYLGSKCGISDVENTLQCRFDDTCTAIFWTGNGTCNFCRCQTRPLRGIPLDIHFGSTLLIRKAFDRLSGIYSSNQCHDI